jgi:hypothetical protein
MHERQRFAIALAGVGGCLCLAAGILLTGPRGIVLPPVDAPAVLLAERLPLRPVPAWRDMPLSAHELPDAPRPPHDRAAGPLDAPASNAPSEPTLSADTLAADPIDRPEPSSLLTRRFAMPLPVSYAPAAHGWKPPRPGRATAAISPPPSSPPAPT